MKRMISLLLCLALVLPTALAAGDSGASGKSAVTAAEAAGLLHDLGLFHGTVAGRFDEESMALDRTATRTEALVMFLRLLGREETVKRGSWSHDFTDVADWAAPYVGYAYQNALSSGAGDGLFGSDRTAALKDYTTFLLRALGYDDQSGDFSWSTADDTGVRLGLYSRAFALGCADGMTRGDLALVSYAALSQPFKESALTLAGSLAETGAVDTDALTAAGILLRIPTDAESVLALVNELRAGQGLQPLVLDEELCALAQIRAQEITEVFDHTRPDGRPCYTVLDDNGYTYRSFGENIAAGFFSAASVMDGWTNSPGHYSNMISSGFGRLGVGRVGDSWVQLFSN